MHSDFAEQTCLFSPQASSGPFSMVNKTRVVVVQCVLKQPLSFFSYAVLSQFMAFGTQKLLESLTARNSQSALADSLCLPNLSFSLFYHFFHLHLHMLSTAQLSFSWRIGFLIEKSQSEKRHL